MTDLAATEKADPSGPQPVSLSRNETEALCLKAARGAGMDWGLAEEAGFAAGWLAACGIDGAQALLDHLTANLGSDWSDLRATPANGHWQPATDRGICPIALGAALSDHAQMDGGPANGRITTDQVSRPILILPFLGSIAQRCGIPFVLSWTGGQVRILADGKTRPIEVAGLARVAAAPLTISLWKMPETEVFAHQNLPVVAALTMAGLDAYALRTTVPASEASRRGAGAMSGDND